MRKRPALPARPIVLHPHPQYGGSMDNNVVDALCDGAVRAGWSCLRFNFRGVGASGGVHGGGYAEASDVAAAAAQWLQDQQKCTLALLGYSFGSLVGSLAASQIAEVDRGAVGGSTFGDGQFDAVAGTERALLDHCRLPGRVYGGGGLAGLCQ